jgi:hypothetical protein
MLPRITPLAIAMTAHVHTNTSAEPQHGVWAHGLQLSTYPRMRAPTMRILGPLTQCGLLGSHMGPHTAALHLPLRCALAVQSRDSRLMPHAHSQQ